MPKRCLQPATGGGLVGQSFHLLPYNGFDIITDRYRFSPYWM